jgi:DNA-binding NarL/FixJ family response regulator
VVIADRSPHFRETLRRVLCETSCAVVGEAGTLRDALRLVRRSGPEVVLLDVDLVIDQPARRLGRMVENLPGLTVIVLLNEDLPGYRQSIGERWGYGCVAKEHAESELPLALPGREIGHRANRS